MHLNIYEIFYSIQSESTYAGMPMIFVRTAGCNLSCSYCDTPARHSDGFILSTDECLQAIKPWLCTHVCITGGEPLMQWDALKEFIALLESQGYQIYLETNGACDIAVVPASVIKIVDIKMPSSGMAEKNIWSNREYLHPHDNIKCVIGNRADYEYAVQVIQQYQLLTMCPILFSPVHAALEPGIIADWILQDQLNVRLQIQLHKYLWRGTDGIRIR